MIQVTVYPKPKEDVYSLLINKEKELRDRNMGTFRRDGTKRRDEDKWKHKSFWGWIRFQRCYGGVVVAEVKSRTNDAEWQLLSSYVGFHHRHFEKAVGSIHIQFNGKSGR